MQSEPTAFRVGDPGIRDIFGEASRIQAWLDVEVALAQAQAELGIIPGYAAEEIERKARYEYLDMDNIREGLARTGHPLVPMVWELDRICEGDAGGYIHWGATTQNITQTGKLLHQGCRPPRAHARAARGARDIRVQGIGLDRRDMPACGAYERL